MSYLLAAGHLDAGNLRFKSKDEVISWLLSYYNADGSNYVRLTYPDGSYFEYEGE